MPGREPGGAGMRRKERERGWRGMRVPEEGKEAASPQLLLSQGLKLWGLSEANFLRGTRKKKKKRKNYYYGEKRSGHSPAGEIKFRPSPGKGKEKMGNEQFSMPVKGHKGGEITPNRDVPGAVPTIRLPRFVLRRFCWRRPNARSKGAC